MLRYPYYELPRYFVEALGIRTGYYMAGNPNGRPMVLLHGMSTSADSFREVMHELAENHWLIAPDIPGFGYSENTEPYSVPHLIEWLASFIEALHLPPLFLMGHSFGGLLSASFAAMYPEDVTRQLLLSPAILSATSYPEMLKKVGVSLGLLDIGSAISKSKLLVKWQIRIPFYDPDKQDESVWERRLADYELSRASASVLKASAFHDLRPYLSQIHHPTCLVWGLNDNVVPHSDAEKLASVMPDTEIHKLDECGHLPMLEQPEQFLAIAGELLNRG